MMFTAKPYGTLRQTQLVHKRAYGAHLFYGCQIARYFHSHVWAVGQPSRVSLRHPYMTLW